MMVSIIPKPCAFNSPKISTKLYATNKNPRFSISTFVTPTTALKIHPQRHRFRTRASSLVLPLLPFPSDQVLVPSEAKTLHLYEARYIALLEESLFEKNKLFVHFVLDPVVFPGISSEASFAARFGCLVSIEKVEQLKVGALVSIRGLGRVKLVKLQKVQPYLTGEVISIQDRASEKVMEICPKVLELREALRSLNRLEIKLKAPPEAVLQTQISNCLSWAEKQISLDFIPDFIPPVAELISFAAFQPVSGATESELLKLQKEKLTAMEVTDTVERLEHSMELVRNNIAVVAAKLAIQSVQFPRTM